MQTIIKKSKKGVTYSRIRMQRVVEILKTEAMGSMLKAFRSYYPYIQGRTSNSSEEAVSDLPRICFCAHLRKEHNKVVVKEYSPLMLLEINNLPSRDEAEAVKKAACFVPFTLLCFIGASGRSVKIVCPIHLSEKVEDLDMERIKKYHFNAFRMLHYHYSSQLGLCVDYLEPTLDRSCLLSADASVYYNPRCEEYYVSEYDVAVPVYRNDEVRQSENILPGCTEMETMNEIFEWCLDDAMSKARTMVCAEDELADATLSLLASYCNESNLPMDFAMRRVGWKTFFMNLKSTYINKVFHNAYEKKISRKRPFGHIEKSALMTYQTEAFLDMHYELRRNIMTGVVQYRPRDGFTFEFRDMDSSVMDSMTKRALKAGLGSWDKDMRRLINSDEIRHYEPLAEYLNSLPEWDGHDRITEFANRLPVDDERVKYFFRMWMLSMVAHWLGKDSRHGNAIVPLLIGGQGCGKTSFSCMVLPPTLQSYYNDKVNFKNDTDLSLGLTSFALINIDEFDSLKRSQQPVLKYLLSKNDVKMRPPYGKVFVSRPRYASFIATTNNFRPLTDPSGSRRFICIRIPQGRTIDFTSPVDYEQLYSQIMYEVMNGARYWLNDEETREVMSHNAPFQRVTDINQIISILFAVPKNEDEGEEMSINQILDIICAEFTDYQRTRSLNIEVGKALKNKGFERKKKTNDVCYRVRVNKMHQ